MKQLKQQGMISLIGSLAAFAGIMAARPVVVAGTGNPTLDVAAVQAAVDQGGSVVLRGHFSFDMPPNTPAGSIYSRMVTISKNVVIAGRPDANGDIPVIEGGNWPFLVDAADAHVTIHGLHCVRPIAGAIWVYSAGGFCSPAAALRTCSQVLSMGWKRGSNPTAVSTAIFVGADPHPPNAKNPGVPGDFSGTLAVLNNDMDVGAIPDALTLGVVMFRVGGSPDKEVNILVSGNTIRNVTEPAINFRVVGGRAYAERNMLITGNISSANSDVIRVVGSGSYVIARNTIDCGWTDGTATGIAVAGQPPPMAPATNATIVDNDITMSAVDGTVFADVSAGIELRGFVQGSSVLNNRIRGRARAALSLIDQNGGMPGDSSLALNDVADFQPTTADIFIDTGVTNTFVFGRQASLTDLGSGTTVVPRP